MYGHEEETADVPLEVIGEPIVVANEFAEVVVRKVRTRNGVRLEIRSPKLDYMVRLDALELESLSWQPVETFSRFLETPWGPR